MLAALGMRPLRLPVGMIKVTSDGFHRLAGGAAAEHGVQHVVGDDRGPATVVAVAGCGIESFQGGLADGFAFLVSVPKPAARLVGGAIVIVLVVVVLVQHGAAVSFTIG